MKLILQEEPTEGAIRVDRAWELFFESKSKVPDSHGERLIPFANWLWDALGRKAGYLNKNAREEAILTIPALNNEALDFLVRVASFWADEVYLKKDGNSSENLWKKPIVNVLDDKNLDASERILVNAKDDKYTRFLMPLLGPSRAFFRVELIQNGESAARYHSHSSVDEFYLILEGSGTLRYNNKELAIKRGDLIAKPTGPDATSQLIADRGEPLRILDMELWDHRARNSKDLIHNPDFSEIFMRGPGWGALLPDEALLPPKEFGQYYDEGYKRTRDGGWVPSRNRGHKKIRERSSGELTPPLVVEKVRDKGRTG
jgi:uncharacterized cupin superfamily protein